MTVFCIELIADTLRRWLYASAMPLIRYARLPFTQLSLAEASRQTLAITPLRCSLSFHWPLWLSIALIG